MTSLQICKHFHNVKREKFSNYLQTSKNINFCDLLSKLKCDPENEKWLCIECGSVGCSRNSENKCSLLHYNTSKHKLVISLTSKSIWCYDCDDEFDSMIEAYEDDTGVLNEKVQKMKDFCDMIKQQLYTFQKLKMTQTNKLDTKVESQTITSSKSNSLPYTPTKVFGLKNLGNTCFFNSVMQCLNGATPLVKFYLDLANLDFSHKNIIQIQQQEANQDDGWSTVEDVSTIKKKQQAANYQQKQSHDSSGHNLINSKYQQFLVQARRSKNNTHDPTDLFKTVSVMYNSIYINQRYSRFKSMAQQDAQELLRCFLDALSTGEEKVMKARGETSDNTEGKSKMTVIENIFGSYLCNYLECLDCGHISRTFDFCLDLAIQISKPREASNITELRHQSNQSRQQVSVDQSKESSQIKQQQMDTNQVDEATDIQQSARSSLKSNESVEESTTKKKNKKKSKNKNKNKKKDHKNQPNANEQVLIIEENEQEKINIDLNESQSEQTYQKQEEYIDEISITHSQDNADLIKYKDYSYSEIPKNQLDKEKIPYFDHSSHILFQIEDNPPYTKSTGISLQDCLDSFTGVEFLNMKNNYFKCDSCQTKNKKSSRALRKFYLYDTPPILTIVLKRFSQKTTGRFEKVVENVDFKEYLDLGSYVLAKGYVNQLAEEIIEKSLNKQMYKLLAVVVHSGTMNGGHYIAYVRHQEQNEDHWYYFSDTTFKEVSIKHVLSAQAYILFYERVG